MKNILIAALVIGASLTSASAFAEGGFAGVDVGRSNYSLDVSGTGSVSDRTTGFKLYGGWEFTPNLAIEGGYADMGTGRVSNAAGTISAKTNALYVAGKGTVPLNEQFSLYGKLGVTRNKADYTVSSGATSFNPSGNKTDLFAAAGVSYAFTKNVAGTLEYDYFGKLDTDGASGVSAKVNMWTLGVRFNF